MPSCEADLRAIVERLHAAAHAGGSAKLDDIPCSRVGRNFVWKVVLHQTVFYIALCSDEPEFARRVLGVEIARDLAQKHDFIAAASTEATFPACLAIVTREVPGTRVDHLLRAAYRIDRNPLQRRSARARFDAALQPVLKFLHALHDEPLPECDQLWDHGAEQTRCRVLANLQRLSARLPQFREHAEPALPQVAGAARHVLLGDSTLGNFLFDGSRIACVDFEDLGIGEPQRDFVVLAESLRKGFERWTYWNADVEQLVPLPDGDAELRFMYMLELNLLRIRKELGRPWWSANVRREVADARRKLLALPRPAEVLL